MHQKFLHGGAEKCFAIDRFPPSESFGIDGARPDAMLGILKHQLFAGTAFKMAAGCGTSVFWMT